MSDEFEMCMDYLKDKATYDAQLAEEMATPPAPDAVWSEEYEEWMVPCSDCQTLRCIGSHCNCGDDWADRDFTEPYEP